MADEGKTFTLLRGISNYLFGHERVHLLNRIDKIVKHHDRLMFEQYGQEKLYGFIFDGTGYRLKEPPVFHRHLRGLHPELDQDMVDITKEQKKLERQDQRIRQALFHVLDPCITTQDVRDALPDMLMPAMGKTIQSLEREREEAFTLAGNEKAMAEYQKARPKIEIFTATRLLV